MAQNYIYSGDKLPYINAGSAITSGSPVFIGGNAGIALEDIAATTGTGTVATEGVWKLPKHNPLAIAQGDLLFWDTTNEEVTKTATDVPLGMAFEAAGSTDTVVNVWINEAGQDRPQVGVVAALGTTTNLPTSNVTLTTSGGNTYSDASTKTAIDAGVNALKTAVETRLDNAEAKIDELIAAMKAVGVMHS